MNDERANAVASEWSRLGVLLNATPAAQTPDIEGLLLDTSRVASSNTQLFTLAASWLARYGEYVARHTLANRIRAELEADSQATLGFMLEWAQARGNLKRHFFKAIKQCGKPSEYRSLSDFENQNPRFADLAEKRASKLSRKWGRWMIDFDIRDDALRPPEWISANNPSIRDRAMVGGDLSATIIDVLQRQSGRVDSEAELARLCGATRAAVRDAVRRLRLSYRVRQERANGSNAIELIEMERPFSAF